MCIPLQIDFLNQVLVLSPGSCRRLTVAQKAKELPPQSKGLDGVETSDENVLPSKALAQEKSNAGIVFFAVSFFIENTLLLILQGLDLYGFLSTPNNFRFKNIFITSSNIYF